jgi:hypothetical protein
MCVLALAQSYTVNSFLLEFHLVNTVRLTLCLNENYQNNFYFVVCHHSLMTCTIAKQCSETLPEEFNIIGMFTRSFVLKAVTSRRSLLNLLYLTISS